MLKKSDNYALAIRAFILQPLQDIYYKRGLTQQTCPLNAILNIEWGSEHWTPEIQVHLKTKQVIQSGSEIWASLYFESSKRGWVANGQDFEWNLKSGSPTCCVFWPAFGCCAHCTSESRVNYVLPVILDVCACTYTVVSICSVYKWSDCPALKWHWKNLTIWHLISLIILIPN